MTILYFIHWFTGQSYRCVDPGGVLDCVPTYIHLAGHLAIHRFKG